MDVDPDIPQPRLIVMVPARLDSQRLPGKVLLELENKPIIVHVFDKIFESIDLLGAPVDLVVLATDSVEVSQAVATSHPRVKCLVEKFECASGTDRCARAYEKLAAFKTLPWLNSTTQSGSECNVQNRTNCDFQVIVNVQGDMPMLNSAHLSEFIKAARDQIAGAPDEVVCMGSPISEAVAANPNITKVVLNELGYAMYFSRAPIPARKPGPPINDTSMFNGVDPQLKSRIIKNCGIYAFSDVALTWFTEIKPGPLELYEGLEQLRWLENGEKVYVLLLREETEESVDTPEQYNQLRRRTKFLYEPPQRTLLVLTTAVCRPELHSQVWPAILKHLLKPASNLEVEWFINIDPVGPASAQETADNFKRMCAKHAPHIEPTIRMAPHACFYQAAREMAMYARQRIVSGKIAAVLYLEDDWKFVSSPSNASKIIDAFVMQSSSDSKLIFTPLAEQPKSPFPYSFRPAIRTPALFNAHYCEALIKSVASGDPEQIVKQYVTGLPSAEITWATNFSNTFVDAGREWALDSGAEKWDKRARGVDRITYNWNTARGVTNMLSSAQIKSLEIARDTTLISSNRVVNSIKKHTGKKKQTISRV